jgi:hypothetical protein
MASVVQTPRSAAFIQLDPVIGSARKRPSVPFGGQKNLPRKMDPTTANQDKNVSTNREPAT